MKAEIREWLELDDPFTYDFAMAALRKGCKYIRYLLAENDELLFTIKDKAEFIEFLQAEAVDHREIIAELEQRVKELEEDEWILVKACLDCSEDMQEVRPGKWQCNNPECPTNQEADNDRA